MSVAEVPDFGSCREIFPDVEGRIAMFEKEGTSGMLAIPEYLIELLSEDVGEGRIVLFNKAHGISAHPTNSMIRGHERELIKAADLTSSVVVAGECVLSLEIVRVVRNGENRGKEIKKINMLPMVVATKNAESKTRYYWLPINGRGELVADLDQFERGFSEFG